MIPPSPSKPVLFFDLGRVLARLDYDEFFATLGSGAVGRSGGFERAWQEFRRNEYILFEKGSLSEDLFFARMKEAFGLADVGKNDLKAAWNGILSPESRMLSLAAGLSYLGECRLVLLSNTNPSHYAYCLETMRELSVFDGYVLSYEVGSMKPEPGIYRAAKKPYPEETPLLFIDDLEENILGAEREGIDGIVFREYGDFLETVGPHPVFGPQIRRAASHAERSTRHE